MKKLFGKIFLFFSLSTLVSCNVNYKWVALQTGEKILTGQIKKDLLEKHAVFPWYQANFDRYTAYNPDAIKYLRKHRRGISYIVFGGTWCEDTHQYLPQFMRIMDDARVQDKRIKLYAVNKEKKTVLNNKSEEYKIEKVPTFIVLYDKKEVGRVVESPGKNIETDLMNIVKLAKPDKTKLAQ